MSTKIPDNIKEFGKELTELARKYDIKSYESKVAMQPSYDVLGFRADVQIHWSSGRHGANTKTVFYMNVQETIKEEHDFGGRK